MPAYSRDSGVWTETIMRQRDGAAWSGDDALGFVRENGAWVQFQAPAGDDDLLQPINLVAVPGDLEATFTWDNPTPLPIVTPTHVQLRIPSTTAVWTEIPYPDAEITFEFLSPGVDYQFQARYIERSSDDGTILLTGNITEVFFTTTALDGPGTPAEDPGGSGPDSTVPWGTPSGGSSCTWEYIVQTATTPASGAITWDDTAVTGSFAGTLSSLEIDFVASGLACGALARFKYRENCSGVLSDYLFGEPFIMQCDWDVACGGIAASTSLAKAIYADPNCLFAFPELCGTRIQDSVNTSIELGKLPGFGSIQTFNGPHTVYGKTSNGFLGKPTLGGQFGNLALLVDGDDLTVTANVHLEEVPGGSSGGSGAAPASMPIVRFGRNVAISAVFSTTTTYVARCSWIDATGTFQSVTGATDLALDEFHRIAVVLDADGTKTLYVDGDADGTNTDTTALAFSDAGIGQDVEVYTNKFMRFNDVAAWDRVLSISEITGLDAITLYAFDVERFFSNNTTYASSSSFNYGDVASRWHMPLVSGTLSLVLQGSSGGTVFGSPTSGKGARIQLETDNARIAAGTEFEIEVASYAVSSANKGPGGGGFGFGGDAGGGGGGTGLRASPFTTADFVAIAGGGGGETWGSSGANGGSAGLTGASASDGMRNLGSGGTQIAGGTAGTGGTALATAGAAGEGGDSDTAANNDGGGGGGGYFGGGGGGGASPTAEGGGGGSSYYDATLFDLTAEQVETSLNHGKIGFAYTHEFQPGLLEIMTAGPGVCFGFIDPSAPNIVDLCGNTSNLVPYATPTSSAESRFLGYRAAKAPDDEAYLIPSVGNSDYSAASKDINAYVPMTQIGPGGEAWSVTAWIKTAAFPATTGAYQFSWGQSAANKDATIFYSVAGGATITVGSSTTTIASATLDDDVWHQITITHDTSGNVLVYLDGAIHTTTSSTVQVLGTTSQLWMWSDYGTERVPRDCGQGPVAFFDSVLSSTQISNQYNAFMAVP